MDREAVGKAIMRRPSLVGGNIDSMERRLVWLSDELGLEERDIAEMVCRFPSILRQEPRRR